MISLAFVVRKVRLNGSQPANPPSSIVHCRVPVKSLSCPIIPALALEAHPPYWVGLAHRCTQLFIWVERLVFAPRDERIAL
jgi:hypothetical protein